MTDTKILKGADVLRALADGEKLTPVLWDRDEFVRFDPEKLELVDNLGDLRDWTLIDHVVAKGATIYTPPPKRYRLEDKVEVSVVENNPSWVELQRFRGESVMRHTIPADWLVEVEE